MERHVSTALTFFAWQANSLLSMIMALEIKKGGEL